MPNEFARDRTAPFFTSGPPAPDREGPLRAFLASSPLLEVPAAPAALPEALAEPAVVYAPHRLQDVADYRAALQSWFAKVRVGGYLVLTVPHAFLHERQNTLPSIWRPEQRRIYTPRLLMSEIEEALAPNTYRVRWLGDDDTGYDYTLPPEAKPVGRHEIGVVLQKIVPPAWDLEGSNDTAMDAPDFHFEPGRTRRERPRLAPTARILILKLDHLGDFFMAMPALERVRQVFPNAEITLVVGSWNQALATDLGLFDRVLAFDVFPRNSAEERVDVHGKTALFDALVNDRYDLAIDLRTDADTRFLLRNVRADIKAGLGTRARFDFLDIFLPIDFSRHDMEAASQEAIPLHDFHSQGFCTRTRFKIRCESDKVRSDQGAILWGPYRRLRPGRYIFEPFIETDPDQPGLLRYDIAVDRMPVANGFLSDLGSLHLPFESLSVEHGEFEFRLWATNDERVPSFTFYGGRLMRQGAGSVLHQSEYLILLIELVARRVTCDGVLRDESSLP